MKVLVKNKIALEEQLEQLIKDYNIQQEMHDKIKQEYEGILSLGGKEIEVDKVTNKDGTYHYTFPIFEEEGKQFKASILPEEVEREIEQ